MKSGYIEGKLLKDARINKNITQFALYHMTGIHQSKISLYENSPRVLIDNPHVKIIMSALEINDGTILYHDSNIKYSEWRNSFYDKIYKEFFQDLLIMIPIYNNENLTEDMRKGIIDERINILLRLIDEMYNSIIRKINNPKLNPYIHKYFYIRVETIFKDIHMNKYIFKIENFVEYIKNILKEDNTELKIAMDTLNGISYKIDL